MRRWWLVLYLVVLVVSGSAWAVPDKKKTKKASAPRWSFAIDEGQARERFRVGLSAVAGDGYAEKIVADPRLVLDRTVTGFGISGGEPCGYFDPCFGLLTTDSLGRGVEYALTHQQAFVCAAERYGVPREVILGILRVETSFGRYRGKRSVLTTLFSMFVFFHSDSRKRWALGEAQAFVGGVVPGVGADDPFAIVGSIAGALGLCQFMPSSYVEFAVDGDRDGRVDLWDDDDAIVSVANYLARNGWGKSRASHRRAVWAYNHSWSYVRAVLAYADAMRALSRSKDTTKAISKKPKNIKKKRPRHT